MKNDADQNGFRQLPPNWEWTTVGEIATSINYGHTARAVKKADGPRFLRITDITPSGVDWSSVPGCSITKADVERCRIQPNDVLFARIGSVGKSFLVQDCPEAVFASYLIRVRLCEWVRPNYLFAFFQSAEYWRQINEVQQGIGRPVVNGTKLANLRVPLAPLAEQSRIADRIDELFTDLDAGVAALERVKRNLKRYRAAVLHAAVTGRLTAAWRKEHGGDDEPADELLSRILVERRRQWERRTLAGYEQKGRTPPKNWKSRYKYPAPPKTDDLPKLPKGWCWATLDQLSDVTGGVAKNQKDAHKPGRRLVPYLRVANVQQGFLDLREIKDISASEKDIEELRLQRGDVLFTEGGDRNKLGRGWIWEEQIPECIHQNHIFRARLFNGNVQPELLSHAGNSYGRLWFLRNGKQSVNLASISLGVLREFPIPLPPLAEQAVIVEAVQEKLSQIDGLEAEVEHGLKRAGRLRQAILKAAFAGRLVEQDPRDEPASALLARLKTQGAANGQVAAKRRTKRRAKRATASGR